MAGNENSGRRYSRNRRKMTRNFLESRHFTFEYKLRYYQRHQRKMKRLKNQAFIMTMLSALMLGPSVSIPVLLLSSLHQLRQKKFLVLPREERRGSKRINFEAIQRENRFEHIFFFANTETLDTLIDDLGLAEAWRIEKNRPAGPKGAKCCGYNVTVREAFAVMLARMKIQGRLDIEVRCCLGINWSRSKLNAVVNTMRRAVIRKWKSHILFNKAVMSDGAILRNCADAVALAGLDINGLFIAAFIDGSHLPIARPADEQDGQRLFYGGHHKVSILRPFRIQYFLQVVQQCHSLNFQAIMLANGIIASVYGPYAGTTNDRGMLAKSKVLDFVENQWPQGYVIAGDAGYSLSNRMLVPFRIGAIYDPAHKAFNEKLSEQRVTCEWAFGAKGWGLKEKFQFLRCKESLCLRRATVGDYFLIATLMVNLRTCLLNSSNGTYLHFKQASDDLTVPTVREYLGLNDD
eukprot:TRINITY_DN1517_c0_g1_i1.p1 TRINITY_DN1517_c0_g1~~TRINITY_DN1517_c0_g1_i1.p1  ORF type:complete len:462 (+),score=20.54 TRINITY_DN1517_c0_g1_i1:102-1487(+)